ncbi:TauD/TfdA family dioxygenase [Streptomyces spectabilis]|uniref:TauD/TfdA family dioxygenase n=1 Tax=Streptomyces spectabilis TaxID=68270 RepID=UPI0034030262
MTSPTPPTPPKIVLGAPLVDLLAKAAPDLPDPVLDGGLLADEPARAYDALRETSVDAQLLVDHCGTLLRHRYGDGYAVIEAEPLLDAGALDHDGKILTILLSWLGTPLRAFDRWPLWKPLGTNLEIEPMRATGSGYNPLHLDLVNTTLPPDYSALLCVRPDPRGGGASLTASLRRAVARLSQDERDLLGQPVFHDGDFFDLTGVGEELDPFPVLDELRPEEGFVRFTAKMLPDMDPRDPHTAAARALERELIADQGRILLGRGDLLIVNQHLSAHGRERLGDGQHQLPAEQRRLVWQMFLRAPGRAA